MNALLAGISVVFILIAAWFGWRYTLMRRHVKILARELRAWSDGTALKEYYSQIKEMELLSSAANSLVNRLNHRLETLQAEFNRLATLLEQLADGVLIADADGMIQFSNPAAEALFGPRLRHISVTEALRHHQLVRAWQKCQDTGEMQVESVDISNRGQFLQLVVVPDRYTSGGSLLLVQDLTRVRRLETVRRDFISNLSHELRTPLASLKALTETLQDGALDDPPAARRFIDRIQAEVDALTQMAQELLDLSRIESGQVALDLKPVAPCKLLHSSAERMRLQAERAGLTLLVDCPPDLPNVSADEPRIEQVLVNLIHNAVKFSRPGGSVIILAEAGHGLVRFAVRDTGIGIPAEDLPRVFERFYKIDRARSSGGTGLGLSIARHLIEGHGGEIWVESLEGQGSTFWFSLPSTNH